MKEILVVVVSVCGDRSRGVDRAVRVIVLDGVGRVERDGDKPLQDRDAAIIDAGDDAVELRVLPVLAILILVVLTIAPAALMAGGIDAPVRAAVRIVVVAVVPIVVVAAVAVIRICIPTVLVVLIGGILRIILLAAPAIAMPVAIGKGGSGAPGHEHSGGE